MKICPTLLIFELLDWKLIKFSGYDFSIFKILLFLDGYFGGLTQTFQSVPSTPPYVQLWSALQWANITYLVDLFYRNRITPSILQTLFGSTKKRLHYNLLFPGNSPSFT